MFRNFESYITPILLSYVDKYIKDFKANDIQLSLWSGSVSLHNLELRPDAIQEELNLPFTLLSGYIYELIIQVPWMKIVSEPIVITINTIECVLKLIDGTYKPRDVGKSNKNKSEMEAPSGYIQSLVNRIVTNISFRCNNVILKYVEEDIVVSVNIKQFYLDNVDGNWVPKFAEITPDDLHIRKLINLSDITLCLDKRNAAGKIETYLEPLLYKSEVEFRVDSFYGGMLNKRPKHTRIQITSPKLEFNFSYQQIPMILRIINLLIALKQKRLSVYENSDASFDGRHASSKVSSPIHDSSNVSASSDYNESWSGWMWSFVQPFPLGYSEEEQDASLNANPILLFSVNFETVTFSFKIPDYTPDGSGMYGGNHRKFRYASVCSLELKSVMCESSSHGLNRFCFRGGFRSIILYPEYSCTCGILDVGSQNADRKFYIESSVCRDIELKEWPIEYDSSLIIENMAEEKMLNICNAFAMEYTYHLTVPEEHKDSNANYTDLEYSNFKEDLTVSLVVGPANFYICSGLIHRLSLMKNAVDSYDYVPYSTQKPLTKRQDLPQPTTDDYDAFMEHIPKINIKVSFMEPKIHISMWDHYSPVKLPSSVECQNSGANLVNRRKISSTTTNSQSVAYFEKLKNMPSILLNTSSVKMSVNMPTYPNRLTYVTCQLPDPPAVMLDSCYKYINLEVCDLQGYLVHKQLLLKNMNNSDAAKHTNNINMPFVTQCNFHVSAKYLLLPDYWSSSGSTLKMDYNFNMDNITVCLTMPKLITLYHMINGIYPRSRVLSEKNEKSTDSQPKELNVLLNTTLLDDAFGDEEMLHLDINFEGLSIRCVYLPSVKTYRVVLNGLKIFAIDSLREFGDSTDPKQVWILSAPESINAVSAPYLKAVLQLSTIETYPTFATLKLEECSFIMDPLFCRWLTYFYENVLHVQPDKSKADGQNVFAVGTPPSNLVKRQSRRSLEEIVNRISGSSRNLSRLSLGHSSSDREKDYIHGSTQVTSQSNIENTKDKQAISNEKPHSSNETNYLNAFIKNYFEWKNVALYLEIEMICVYFPTKSVSAVNYDSVSEAIRQHVANDRNVQGEDVLVIRLPNTTLKTSSLKQSLLSYCIYGLPVKFPVDILDCAKVSYPWTVMLKNLSCFSISCKRAESEYSSVETNVLMPVSSDITVSFTPKVGTRSKMKKKESVTSIDAKQTQHLLRTETDKSAQLPNEADEKNSIDALSSIGICIHIDTELVLISLNYNQLVLMKAIAHGVKELCLAMSLKNEKVCVASTVQPENYYSRLHHRTSMNDMIMTNNLEEEDLSKDSDLPSSSCELPESSKIDKKKKSDNAENSDGSEDLNITIWMQWTISRLCMKAYASTDSVDANYLKLVFSADDIVSSLDIQREYLKWKTKVVTAAIHHYKRSSSNAPWFPGKFCGIIIRGRENIKRSKPHSENCFLSINITKAICSSVHNKWKDMCKITPRAQVSDKDYISEIEVSLQALDFIFNLASLKPFIYLISLLSNPVDCEMQSLDNELESHDHTNENTIAKSWDCRKLPLCYFEGSISRIFIPVESSEDSNVVIVQMDKISVSSAADNPVCRLPLRPDLYQQAAKRGYLSIPGSELEDRQCQLTMKGICLHTVEEDNLEKSFDIEAQSQSSVNPALQWNNSLLKLSNSLPMMTVMEKVDICMVFALSMFYKSELICGPTVDLNIVTDIELYLSTAQVLLFTSLLEECRLLFENSHKTSSEGCDHESSVSVCPYQKFFNKKHFKIFKDVPEYNIERNSPRLSIDTGIASDKMSNTTSNSKGSPRTFSKQSTVPFIGDSRLSIADYYDAFVTSGKINVILFEKPDPSCCETPLEEINESDLEQNQFPTKPLIYVSLVQPNFSYSRYHYIRKSQFSIFQTSVSLGEDYYRNGLPKVNDFLTAMFETKIGVPDSVSEISPNFLTVKWERNIGKRVSMKADIKCPVRVTASLDRVNKLNMIKRLLLRKSKCDKMREDIDQSINRSKFKTWLDSYDNIDVATTQIVFALNVQDDIDFELLLSVSAFKNCITFNPRHEKISSIGLIDSLSTTLRKTDDRQSKILINPWTIGFEANVFWDSWLNVDVRPIYRLFFETDRLLIELSAEHLKILGGILNFYQKNQEMIMTSLNSLTGSGDFEKRLETADDFTFSFWNQVSPQDQHYKDDLRAGAFKFIQSDSGTPLPYQVFIGHKGLTWRYPQPRAITCVQSFPVPFQVIIGDEISSAQQESILCTLEYYSEILNDFQYYARFSIRQDQRLKLEQTKFDHRTVLSSMWRVVMHSTEAEIGKERSSQKHIYFNKNKYTNHEIYKLPMTRDRASCSFPISSKALAACLRIDSLYTPHLLPGLQATFNVSMVEVIFFNNNRHRPLPFLLSSLQLYEPNGLLPSYHVFCSASLQSFQLQGSAWSDKILMAKMEFDAKFDVIEGSEMLLDNVVDLKEVSFLISRDEEGEVESLIHMNDALIHCGPQHIQTLNTSYQIWKDILLSNILMTASVEFLTSQDNQACYDCTHSKPDMVIPKYVICNDSNLTLRFGQIGTDENIVLETRKCHLYSWKMYHATKELFVAINLGNWNASKGLSIEKPGTTVVQLTNESVSSTVSIVVLVEVISPVHRCVTFMGQLVFLNMFHTMFCVKIYHKGVLQLHGVSGSPYVTIDKSNRSHSMLIDTSGDTTMRLHFSQSEAGWSGDIPVKECSKGNMPWLVKVPISSAQYQYTSVWCRVIKNNAHNRTLIVLSPLYIIKSHLPTEISINVNSEGFECSPVDSLVDGKGAIRMLSCPGTTSTKHEIVIDKLYPEKEYNDTKIPLSYNLVDQSTFFSMKEENPNIDIILNDVKNWLDSWNKIDNEWPYISVEDGTKWKSVNHHHKTDINVQYLPAIPAVDSMILDISPWALMGNCSGSTLHLLDSKKETLCQINHREIIIPPSVISKEAFYYKIYDENSAFVSDLITISNTPLGPYEKKIPGNVTIDNYSCIALNCGENMKIFTMGYEIKEKMSMFRLSSRYIFVNQLPCDVKVIALALSIKSKTSIFIPSKAEDISLLVPINNNSNSGVPINKFYILRDANGNDEVLQQNVENYNLYISCSLPDQTFSCSVRLDSFMQRKAITLNMDGGKSLPIIITCQENKGQVFIGAYKDTSPQFLIQNKADMAIAVAQVLQESIVMDMYSFASKETTIPQTVVQECHRSNWHCVINPEEESYYTMPTQSNRYPELYQSTNENVPNSENLYLTFAFFNGNGTWSIPVVLTTSTLEQFVKLPGYKGDIKVMIENHCHSTLVTVNNVTQDDISASDIRQRLFVSVPVDNSDNEHPKEAIYPNKYSKKDDKDDIFNKGHKMDDSLENHRNNSDRKLKHMLRNLKINAMFNRVNVILCNNNDVGEFSRTGDIISLTLDKLVTSLAPSQNGFKVSVTMGELQIDNPLYLNGGYDFNVMLVRQPSLPIQEKKDRDCDWKSLVMSRILNVEDIFKEVEIDCLIKCANEIEMWKEHNTTHLGWSELSIVIGPISVYLEDTYISTLVDFVTDFIPTTILVHCTHTCPVAEDCETLDNVVFIPDYIILDGQAVSYPFRLKRLCIDPLNVLLSVHSTMLLYLALDHSPLQFAKFERINVLTSSYRLGHALTMHYLSEAIFGAGWVVGSLEILGSPSGLARRVSAGLRDLVREPCLGLMRGPWGFIVGMTHGSVSLVKHLTQGTVESVSMVMGSVARNLDRLSLDEDHIRRTERARRHRPLGLIPALTRGFQGLGLSLLGAIGGIAHEALIAGIEQGRGPAAVAAGLTRGLVGVITKPLSATADLLALTGQGLLHQAGWNQNPNSRYAPLPIVSITQKNENFRLKLGNTFAKSSLLFVCQGINKDNGCDITLLVTNMWLIILDTFKDKVIEVDELEKWRIVKCNQKTGDLVLGVKSENKQSTQNSNTRLDTDVQMDPVLRARIAAYVGLVEDTHVEERLHRLVFSSKHCGHCSTIISFARSHSLNHGFPVI